MDHITYHNTSTEWNSVLAGGIASEKHVIVAYDSGCENGRGYRREPSIPVNSV